MNHLNKENCHDEKIVAVDIAGFVVWRLVG